MIPITLIAGIVCELIIGKYDNSKRIAIAFSVVMFTDSMHSILLTKILGVGGLVKYMSSTFSPEQAAQMVAAYTNEVILIAAAVNVVLCLLAGFFGVFINNKFFEKGLSRASSNKMSRSFSRFIKTDILLNGAKEFLIWF